MHRDGEDVAVFSRSLDNITARVPEIVAAALALPGRVAVLDGEALARRRRRAGPSVPGDRHRAPAGSRPVR